MKKIIIFCLCLFCATGVLAQEKTARDIAEEILNAMHAKEKIAARVEQLVAIQTRNIKEIIASKDAIELQKQITEIYEKTLSWDSLKEEFINLYVDTFSKEELAQIFSFYSSQTGQKLLEKQGQITQKSVEITEAKLSEILPQIQEMIRQQVQDIQVGDDGYLQMPQEDPEENKGGRE